MNAEEVAVSYQNAQRMSARGRDGCAGKLQAFRFESTTHEWTVKIVPKTIREFKPMRRTSI
jgi:hypothetical protein